jgi:hypothetical protein
MATTNVYQEQVSREAPEIEAYKLGLLKLAKEQASTPVALPPVRAAGLTPQQIAALELSAGGVGSYAPFLSAASDAYTLSGEGYSALPEYGAAGMEAAGRAMDAAGERYERLPEYGAAGMGAAEYGRAGVEGALGYGDLAAALGLSGAASYDPNSVVSYMNPYQEEVTRRAVDEMSRQAQIQQNQLSSQAVRSGAFGGTREGVQRAELSRNLADVQSKKIFEDYYANYTQAQTAAMNAFANQQGRAQNAGNIALGAGQLGVSGAIQAGQLGVNAAGQAGNLESAGAAGIASLGNLGVSAATAAGQLQQGSAAGLGALGEKTADLGRTLSGLQQGDVSFLYNIGEQQRQQRQRELDAQRNTELAAAYEPYQRISFISDIYKGAPSSQNTITASTAPAPSVVSQVAGLGTAGLAAYNLTKN